MPDSGEAIAIRVVERIETIDAAAWDACAGTDNPFLTYAFLHALEASGSATAETGWRPQHLVAEDSLGLGECCGGGFDCVACSMQRADASEHDTFEGVISGEHVGFARREGE